MKKILIASTLALALAPLAQAQEASNSHSGNWWDPADSGWGVASLDQGNVLGAYWFSYDDSGRPTWLMGVGLPQADGSYAGDLFRVTGIPFQDIDNAPSGKVEEQVGSVHLAFDADPHAMAFTTTIDGNTVTRNMSRYDFSGKDVVCSAVEAADARMTNYTDMWWEPATTGWGINVIHLDDKLYGQWYTYETPDQPVFMTITLERQGDGSYLGPVYRQNDGGRPFRSAGKDNSEPGAEVVGTASLLFLDGLNAEFDYVVGEDEGHHELVRFQFGDVANQCKVVPYAADDGDDGDGNDGSIDGELCAPPYAIGDTRTLRSVDIESGQAGEPYVFNETIVGEGSFNGQQGFKQMLHRDDYAGDGRYAYNHVGSEGNVNLSFGAVALDPGTDTVISTSTNDPARVEIPRYFKQGETVEYRYVVNSTSAAGPTRTEIKATHRLVGMESVTVPAGTFNACKLEYTLDSTSSGSGFEVHALRSGFTWSDPHFGMVKFHDAGTATVSAFGTTTTSEVGNDQKLLEASMGGRGTP